MEFHGPRTQILAENTATNATVIVRTVPAGKKFFLIESMLSTNGGAAGIAQVAIRDAADAHVRYINRIDSLSAVGAAPADHFEPGWPVELPAGYDITVISGVGALIAEAGIFGYEVDA